jgi:hypothetical protein
VLDDVIGLTPNANPPAMPRGSEFRLRGWLASQPLHCEQRMNTTTNQNKLKWKALADPTKFELRYPPARAPRGTEQWDRWVTSMMLDTRLSSADRVVLTRLALHYNLETGDCFPAVKRIAIEAGLGEAGWRTVQRTTRKATQLGWIELTIRKGGPAAKNQTNLYELRLPEAIIGYRNIGLKVTGQPGAWQVAQIKDGEVVCGPFKQLENAERWIEEHGPGSETRPPTRQTRDTDTTKQVGDTTMAPPITGKLQNREVIEHSVSKDTASFAPRPYAINRFDHDESKKGAIEKGLPRKTPYDLGDVDAVRDLISCYGHVLNGYQAMSIGGLVECARQHKQHLDGGTLRAMATDGHFGINRKDQLYVLEGEE